jgi:hypothetical protein
MSRRLRWNAALSSLLVVAAGVLTLASIAAAPSQAAVTDASPSHVGNWSEAGGVPAQPVRVTFTTTPVSAGTTGTPVPVGADVIWQRSGAPNDRFHSVVDQNLSTAQDHPSTSVDFSNVSPSAGAAADGPANPGAYDVIFQSSGANGMSATVFDSCTRCVTVESAGSPVITSAAPFEVAAGVTSQPVSFSGRNLARGSAVRALLPDGTTDPNITFSRATSATPTPNSGTFNTVLHVDVTVAPGTPPGTHDIEVLSTDLGRSTCQGCLTVMQNHFDTVVANTGLNTAASTQSITFSGASASIPVSTAPALKFVGLTDEATRPLLILTPTQVTSRGSDNGSITADFDLRGAAPGSDSYQPILYDVFTQETVSVCGCRFTVVQSARPALTAVNPSQLFRNGTTAVTISGLNFSKGTSVVVTGGGVTARESQFVSSDTVRLKLGVEAAALPGARDVVARTTDGQTSAVCRGCITIQQGAFASPAPSRTTSPTPSAESSPTASSSPETSRSPSPPPVPTRDALEVSTSTPNIHPNETAVLDVRGSADESVELRCYSRPNSTYATVRRGALDVSGQVQFRLQPGTNTRCYATYGDDDSLDSSSLVISVHTTLSLSARRLGVRSYEFRGRTLPRMAGQLVTLYRLSNGSEVRTGSARTDANGIWSLTRAFSGAGTFPFLVRTSQTLNNAPGESQRVTVRIY